MLRLLSQHKALGSPRNQQTTGPRGPPAGLSKYQRPCDRLGSPGASHPVRVAVAGVQAQPSHGSAGGFSEQVQGRNPQYTLLTSNLRACGGHVVAQRLGAQSCCCCCCCVASVVSNSVRLHRLPHPWDSPGKNTGVGCHFILQCVLVKLLSCVQLLTTP